MTTYATLIADTLAWLVRPDLGDTLAASFIRLAEAEIRRTLRVRAMEEQELLTLTGFETPLPARWIQFKAVSNDVANQRPLTYMPPDRLRSSGLMDSSGVGSAYSIEGENILVAPTNTGSISITSYKAFAALSSPADTNWALTNAYDLYLFGSVAAGFDYLEDTEQEGRYRAKFEAVVKQLNREHQMAAWGTAPKSSGGRATP